MKCKPLEGIEGYFPVVVDRELFERVASRARATAARGRTLLPPLRLSSLACSSVFTVAERSQGSLGDARLSRVLESKPEGREERVSVSSGYIQGCGVGVSTERTLYHQGCATWVQTEELEAAIANLDDVVSVLAENTADLADEVIREKSGVVRQRLRDKEAEFEKAKEDLRALKAQTECLAAPYVQRRLDALMNALKRKPFSTPRSTRR